MSSLGFRKSDRPLLNAFEELLNAYKLRPGLNHLCQLLAALINGACNLPLILFVHPSRVRFLLLSPANLGSLFCLKNFFAHYFNRVFDRLHNLRNVLRHVRSIVS